MTVRCKKCGQPIVWVREGIFNHWVPYNRDLTSHFKTCVPSEATFVKDQELKRLEEENHV